MSRKHEGSLEPWIPSESIPDVLREFNINRDPYIRLQLLDLEKTESQRRDESVRYSRMVERDKPQSRFTPPQEIREAVDRRHFNKSWLAEQRDAAFAQAKTQQFRDERSQSRSPVYHEPSR